MTQLDQSFEPFPKLSLHSNIRPRLTWFPALLITSTFFLDKPFTYFPDRHERNL